MNAVLIIPGIIIATLVGLGFYFVVSDRFYRLFIYVVSANFFFFLGQFISQQIGWTFLRVGSYNLFPALLSTFLGLILIRFFSVPVHRQSNEKR